MSVLVAPLTSPPAMTSAYFEVRIASKTDMVKGQVIIEWIQRIFKLHNAALVILNVQKVLAMSYLPVRTV